jgi:hypothetical protein
VGAVHYRLRHDRGCCGLEPETAPPDTVVRFSRPFREESFTLGGRPLVGISRPDNPAAFPYDITRGDDDTMMHSLDDGIWQVPNNGGTPKRIVEATDGEDELPSLENTIKCFLNK